MQPAIDRSRVLLAANPAGDVREGGGGLCGLAGAAHQRSLRTEVAGSGPEAGRGLISPRLRSGPDNAAQNRSVAHQPASARRTAGVAVPVALRRHPPRFHRLGIRLALHQGQAAFWPAQLLKAHIKPIALSLGLPNIGWHSFRHTVSAWGKEAGSTGRGENAVCGTRTSPLPPRSTAILGMEAKRTDSAAVGELRQAAGHPRSVTAGNQSVNLRDPYLTRAVLRIGGKSKKRMAPQVGLEPTTLRLTAGCSAIELLRSVCSPRIRGAM